VVYAADPDSLNILIYRLNCDGESLEYDDDAMSKQDQTSTKNKFSNGSPRSIEDADLGLLDDA
jgi:hypothetical protein